MAFSNGKSSFELPPEIDLSPKSTLERSSTELAGQGPKVVILGTGDFGQALASRFLQNGYQVVMGSRYPTRRNLAARNKQLLDIPVVPMVNAIQEAEIIFLAIPAKEMVDALREYSKHLAGKVLVDVSNNSKIRKGWSHAEELAEAFPGSLVVKAFNTMSAYALQSGLDAGSMEVQIASDSPYAREVVSGLARDMGLQAIIYGGLRSARELEKVPLKLWRGWGKAVLVTVVTYLAWGAYGTWRDHFRRPNDFSSWPTHTNNKIMGCVALTLLALCFLPGSIASVLQLVYGTKHRAFPSWLNGWLNMRKQLGLLALFLASIHCVLSVAHISPAYFRRWYDMTSVKIPVNQTQDIRVPLDLAMNWKGEMVILLGTLALALMALLGITSLPSVGGRLNWRQWTFIQSFLGHVCLVLSIAHVSVLFIPAVFQTQISSSIQWMSVLSTLIPYFALIFRLLLLLPCFSIPVWRIRSGWERGIKNNEDVEKVQMAGANLQAYTNKAFTTNGSQIQAPGSNTVQDNAM